MRFCLMRRVFLMLLIAALMPRHLRALQLFERLRAPPR